MPLVSVIVPLYNAAATVLPTIRSVQAQTLTDWECLIINDGSTDEGPALVNGLVSGDDRFRTITQHNKGLAAARNAGLDHARGRFIHFLDSDDWIAPRALASLTAAAEPTGAAAGAWDLRGAAGSPLGRTMDAPAPALTLNAFLDGNRIAPHSHLIRADLLKTDRFNPTLRVVEDFDLWLRLAERGLQWTTIDSVVASYRVRPGSLSKNPRLMFDTHRAVLTSSYERLRRNPHPGVDGSTERRSSALRRSAAFYVTVAALQDPDPAKPAAVDLLRQGFNEAPSQPPALSAADLGAAACWALLLGFAVGPATLLHTSSEWIPHLADWWSRCHALGWSTADPPRALEALVTAITDPTGIADALLDAAPSDRPMILVGLGQNGHIVRRRAAARGLSPDLRDDHAAGARSITDSVPTNATILVSPTDDRAILSRLPRDRRIIRWADHQRAIADAIYAPLAAAWQSHASGTTTRETPSLASR